jgi:hypothetical protein
MGRFASAKHLASWAGVCPGNQPSAGKRLGGKRTNGNTWLRALLGAVAWSIAHPATTSLAAQSQRLARRRGRQKAIVAVCHTRLVIISHLRRDHRPYHELGPDCFERLDTSRLQRHDVQRLQSLGFTLTLTPLGAA